MNSTYRVTLKQLTELTKQLKSRREEIDKQISAYAKALRVLSSKPAPKSPKSPKSGTKRRNKRKTSDVLKLRARRLARDDERRLAARERMKQLWAKAKAEGRNHL